MKSLPLHLPRLIVLGLCTIFSVVILGLLAHLTHISSKAHAVANYEVMGLVTSILSILIFPVMMITPRFLFILTELVFLCIMWILWVVTAALTIQARDALFGGNCGIFVSNTTDMCHEITAVEGISITIFVLLMLYMLCLFVFAITTHFRHSNKDIWFQRTNEGRASTTGTQMT